MKTIAKLWEKEREISGKGLDLVTGSMELGDVNAKAALIQVLIYLV
jgi:hypothetical protein